MGRRKRTDVEPEGEVVDVEFKNPEQAYERAPEVKPEESTVEEVMPVTGDDKTITTDDPCPPQPVIETNVSADVHLLHIQSPEPKIPEEPRIIQRVNDEAKTISNNIGFETIKDLDMFMPEKSERDGYYLKLRAAKGMDGIVYPSHTYQRDDDVLIYTGVKYNSVFKSPHFVKELPELCHKHGIFMGLNTMDLDGELVLHMYIRGSKVRFNQGMPIAELVVIPSCKCP